MQKWIDKDESPQPTLKEGGFVEKKFALYDFKF